MWWAFVRLHNSAQKSEKKKLQACLVFFFVSFNAAATETEQHSRVNAKKRVKNA